MLLAKPGRVDWDVVDEDLDRIPVEFKDPRFDSLRHVLDILSAVDAEAALEELKAQQERIELLVDDVVQGYHSGFNKAINNYSQILHLFSVSKDQVLKLRSQLEDAQRRLVMQSRSLELQWKRSASLSNTVKLLADVRGFGEITNKVQVLQDNKQWPAAVSLLLEGCSKLARPEYSGIGALKEIKRELASHRNVILKSLVAIVEKAVFEETFTVRSLGDRELPAPGSPAQTPAAQGSKEEVSRSLGQHRAEAGARVQSLFDWRKASASPGASLQSKGTAVGPKGINPIPELERQSETLISCVARIGGIGELQSAMRRHLPYQVENLVLRTVESSRRQRTVEESSTNALQKAYAIQPATADAAKGVVSKVFDSCLQVLHQLLILARLIAAARTPPPSAGLDLLLAARLPDPELASTPKATFSVKREMEFAWECMQKEVQALLSKLLQPRDSQMSVVEFQAGLSSAEGSVLSFCFDVQTASSALQRESSLRRSQGKELPQVVQSALWGFQGSLYLTPHLFQPAKEFSEGATNLLALLDKEDSSGSTWFGTGDRSECRQALQQFLASFVENVFMPTLLMDFKSRCGETLQDQEALRVRAKPQSVGSAGSRPLLPAVRVVETIVEELLEWAVLMPAFATRLMGILENILGRVVDAFHAHAMSLLTSTACKALSEDPGLAAVMAAERAAASAGDAVAFFVGPSADGLDQFVTSVLKSGFASGGDAAESAVLQRLLKERPIASSALLSHGDSSRVSNLAATADSLEHLAEVIQATVMEHKDMPRLFSEKSVSTPRARRSSTDSLSGPAAPQNPPSLMDSLDHLVDRYRSLAGQCLRALRLDALLLVIQQLGELPKGAYVCEASEAQDIEECIGGLQRAASKMDDALTPYLPPEKRAYVFSGTAPAAARYVIWLLPELKALNQAGLAKMCRMLAVLQPFLAALGSAGGLFRPEAARHLENARAYYAHLTFSPEALIASASARPDRFTPKEYMALLEVKFTGRIVQETDRAQLAKAILAAAKLNAR